MGGGDKKKLSQHDWLDSFVDFGGEDEIRTRGTLIRYVGLANRWFQPLTHLSGQPVFEFLFNWVCKYRIFLSKYKIIR